MLLQNTILTREDKGLFKVPPETGHNVEWYTINLLGGKSNATDSWKENNKRALKKYIVLSSQSNKQDFEMANHYYSQYPLL